MKNFEFIDVVVHDGERVNLYLSLENGKCYTFTDEEVEMMETAQRNIERRRRERERKKVIRARRAKRNKKIAIVALIGLLLFLLHSTQVRDFDEQIEPSSGYEQDDQEYNYRSHLVDLLNAANGEYEDSEYRNLFYLYYNTYCSDIKGEYLINSLIPVGDETSILTKDDFNEWCQTGKVNFKKLMAYPEFMASKVDYDNIDIFLNFNICLKKEVEEDRLELEEYLNYINNFLIALNSKDADLKRVWDYYSENNSTINGFVDVKLLCYEDIVKRKNNY